MIKTKKRLRVCVTLLILNLIFIWGNSLLPGRVSAALSQAVNQLLALLLPATGPATAGHGLLRKLAHFSEFALLGMILTWLFGMLGKGWPPALLCGFLAAGVDESIQLFVPDRGPSFFDVGIDTAGAALGILLLLAGHAIYWKNHRKKENRSC